MKKLMISTIILMPLLILAIMLVSGAILSIVTHIYVEKVEFVENATLILVMKDEDAPPAQQVDVNVFPLKADNRDLVYSVEDESICSVDGNGVVTANYFGETFVTVSSIENKAATAKRRVLVTDNTVHALRIREFENDLYRGDEPLRLLVDILPYEANNKQVVWTSSDESVLSVSESGDVICKGAGVVTVTVSSVEKPEITDTVEIRCHEPIQSISAEYPSVVTAAETASFPRLTSTPENATYTVSYASSDEEVARVDEKGNIVFLKAGVVTITATATDGRAHSDSVSVRYNCTNGYFMGALFEKTAYQFDYDTFAGKALSDIVLKKVLEGSYREILDVTFTKAGILSFDKNKEEFFLNDVGEEKELGTITVTIRANKYDYDSAAVKEFVTDICNVTITRNAKSISFVSDGQKVGGLTTDDALSFGEGNVQDGIGVLTSPKNHTDTLSFEIEGDAYIKNGSTLVFEKEGEYTVKVIATAKDGNGNVTAQSTLSVTHVEPKDSETDIPVDSATEREISLSLKRNGTKETGVLSITAPEGTTAKCVSDHPEIVSVDESSAGVRLVPQKGGFATVTVTFEPAQNASGVSLVSAQAGKLHIYVNKAVSDSAISFSFDNNHTTSKDRFDYTVTIETSEDAMAGKKLVLDGVETKIEYKNGKFTGKSSKSFKTGENEATVLAQVVYDAEARKATGKEVCAFANCKLKTTHGNLLLPPKVTLKEQTLDPKETTALDFGDIGDKIVLLVDANTATPDDFTLTKEAIVFSAEMKFDFEIELLENGTAKITLTAQEGGSETTVLSVAGQEYSFAVKVLVVAHSIEVKFDDTVLNKDTEYTTLLSPLKLAVFVGREDGETITDTKVSYSFDGGEWHEATLTGKVCNLSIVLEGRKTVTIKSGKAEIKLNIQKLELKELDLKYHIEYPEDKKVVKLDQFEVKDESQTFEFSFPKAIQGHFDIVIEKPELQNNLGGFEQEEMKKFFKLEHMNNGQNEWSYNVSADTLKITVTIPQDKTYFIDEEFTFTCGEKKVTLIFNCADFVRVEMEGFDNTNPSNVYLGYQQVRVFAKQSYYNNEKVDYFRVPIKTLTDITDESKTGDPAAIIWDLTRVKENGDRKETLVSRQRGYKVIVGDEIYTIEKSTAENGKKCSTLKDKDNKVIAQNGKFESGLESGKRVTWIDVFAETGYAHIYFGDFGGLSETDVQNDYFGNFGEKADWKAVPQAKNDGSGRSFDPSENAYTYLRVEAGDGVKESEVNTHFNFNVLDEKDLLNVFDADGYYANQKIVLHNDLYGKDELEKDSDKAKKAEEQGLVLTQTNTNTATPWKSSDSTVLGKTIIYGNGYQVNFEAKNAQLKEHQDTGTSHGVYLQKAINVNVKASNPTETITKKNQVVVMMMEYGYYCTIENYSKMSPWGAGAPSTAGHVYLKNTVLRRCSQSALQLYYGASTAWIENVVQNECVGGFTADSKDGKYDVVFNLKGFVDVLNYMSYLQLGESIGTGTYLMAMFGFSPYLRKCDPYLEWLGKTPDQLTDDGSGGWDVQPQNWWGTRFANVFLYNRSLPAQNSTITLKFWNEDSGSYEVDGSLKDGVKVKAPIDTEMQGAKYKIFVYDTTVNSDGGLLSSSEYGSRNMSQLFSNDRYIRLLCQYTSLTGKGADAKPVKNNEHILWHTQRVYRDLDLYPVIGNREPDHIKALKKSLINVKWPDGTCANEYIQDALSAEEKAKLDQNLSAGTTGN